MDRQPVLSGELFMLRPLVPDDWDALYAVAADPLIWQIHPAHDRWQEPVFRAFFDDALAQGGALAMVEHASGEIIGSSRFQNFDPADGGVVEIGWTFLARRLWGTGANAQMKQLMLMHALDYVARVEFRVGETNFISRKAMEHIGGILTGREDITVLAGVPQRHVIYEITRDSFAKGPLASTT